MKLYLSGSHDLNVDDLVHLLDTGSGGKKCFHCLICQIFGFHVYFEAINLKLTGTCQDEDE